jgi:hypothetical protein
LSISKETAEELELQKIEGSETDVVLHGKVSDLYLNSFQYLTLRVLSIRWKNSQRMGILTECESHVISAIGSSNLFKAHSFQSLRR